MFYESLSLPRIDEDNVEYFGEERGRIARTFIKATSDLELRLEASYNKPILTLIRKILRDRENKGDLKLDKLANVSRIFTPGRFKRPYVKDTRDGIPLLQGGHISWVKPYGIRCIWKDMKNIEDYIVKKNWILVTCSGTIGRTAIVRKGWQNLTATNHMTRVIPERIHPGFLTIYLQSIYGQQQLKALSYGGVVEEIGEAGELFNDVIVPVPSSDCIQEEVGNLVLEAYDKKDQANILEEETVRMLENRLEELAK